MGVLKTVLAGVGFFALGAGTVGMFAGGGRHDQMPDASMEGQLAQLRVRMDQMERSRIRLLRGPHELGAESGEQEPSASRRPGGGSSPARLQDGTRRASEGSVASGKARADARTRYIQAALEQESRDRRWAADTEAAIEEAAAQPAFSGSRVTRLECRSTLCRVDVSHEGLGEAERFSADFVMSLPSLPRATIRRMTPESDGPQESVLFLVRDGFHLPLPPPEPP